MEPREKKNENDNINTISINYEEDGILLVKELKKIILSKPVISVLNSFFCWLDAIYFRPNPVAGYIVIAKK